MAMTIEREKRILGDTPDRRVASIAWDPGPGGWVTLNSDGPTDYRAGKAAADGLLRDSSRRFLLANSMNVGIFSITRAEMQGAIKGLQRV
ncbi:hypothetical protein LINPERHAP1_LOCUS1390 [Linum perenne]